MTSQRERGRGEKKLIILQTQVGGGGGSDGKGGATEWQTDTCCNNQFESEKLDPTTT